MFSLNTTTVDFKINADNVKDIIVSDLKHEIAGLQESIVKAHEFIAAQHVDLAREMKRHGKAGMFDNMTRQWISNSEGCIEADTKRLLIAQTMLDAMLAS